MQGLKTWLLQGELENGNKQNKWAFLYLRIFFFQYVFNKCFIPIVLSFKDYPLFECWLSYLLSWSHYFHFLFCVKLWIGRTSQNFLWSLIWFFSASILHLLDSSVDFNCYYILMTSLMYYFSANIVLNWSKYYFSSLEFKY